MTLELDPRLVHAAQAAVDFIKQEIKGLKAVIVSTEDGFEVANHLEGTGQASRLSAMVSSLAALGSVAGEENRLGVCEHITLGFTGGHLVTRQARHPQATLIVSVLLGKDAIVGQALYFCTLAVKQIEVAAAGEDRAAA